MIPADKNNPFIGLRSYESDESILFFGRHEQTLDLLQRLHQFRFLAVTGSSGSGKSSLVKAGLIPRLKAGYLVNIQSEWAIIIMKPGEDALLSLCEVLLDELNMNDNTLTAVDLKKKIATQSIGAITEIIKLPKQQNKNYFLLVDQFEELFRFSFNKSEIERKDEAANFVNILLEISKQQGLNFYIAITMRSDFIGDCAQFYGLPQAINKGLYLVPRLSRTQLETIVEAPVHLRNKKISPALTSIILNDAQMIEDSLPLLQHALMRTWDYEININKDGELDLVDYNGIGKIQNALSVHADEVLHGMTDDELKLTQKIFQALTAVDVNGRKIRRPAHLKELVILTGATKETVLKIINRFIEGNKSFLITTQVENKDDLLIDISHESLIRQWSLLNNWVDKEADDAKIFLKLLDAEKSYKAKHKNLLRGNELNQFWSWYFSFHPKPEWAKRYSDSYNDCINYLKRSKTTAVRNRWLFITAIASIFIIISLFSIKVYNDYIESQNQLALNYWQNSKTAADKNNTLDALHLIAQSAVTTKQNDVVKNLFINAEELSPVTCLKKMYAVNALINSVVFSADGKWILTACNNGDVFITDKATGKIIRSFANFGAPVVSAVFSNDEKIVATASINQPVRIWDVASGSLINQLKNSETAISVHFNNDMKLLVAGCSDSYARIWNLSTGNEIKSFKQNDAVTGAVFNKDANKLLTCGNDSTAHLWDVATGKSIYTFHHSQWVTTAVFSADEKKILTTSYDSTARIWNAETGEPELTINNYSEVRCGAFSADGKLIATGTWNGYVRFWNIENNKPVTIPLKHNKTVYSIDFSKDGKWIVTGGADKIVRVWNIEPVAVSNTQSFATKGIVNKAVFNNDGQLVLTSGNDSATNIFNAATGKLSNSYKENNAISNAVFSKDGNIIAFTRDDSTAELLNVSLNKKVFLKCNDIVTSVVFSSDDNTVLTTSKDSVIRIWSADGQLKKHFHFTDKIRNGVFSPDDKSILITGDADTAYILNAETGKIINSFVHDESIRTAVFSPDGKWVLTSAWDSTARYVECHYRVTGWCANET